jgi:hypothetical protein
MVEVNEEGAIRRIVLNAALSLVRLCIKALKALLKSKHFIVILSETYDPDLVMLTSRLIPRLNIKGNQFVFMPGKRRIHIIAIPLI